MDQTTLLWIAGILLGPFLGAVIGELSLQRPLGEAGRAGIGATIGLFIVARFFNAG